MARRRSFAHMRTDMVMLTPMMSAVADMVPDNPGTWLFHCHMNGHFGGGMYSLFTVLPRSPPPGGRPFSLRVRRRRFGFDW